jgi:hypothetical protein
MARNVAIFARASASYWGVGVGVVSLPVVGVLLFKGIVVIFSSYARLCVLLLFSNRVEERQGQVRMEMRAPDVEGVHRSLPFSIKATRVGIGVNPVVLCTWFSSS